MKINPVKFIDWEDKMLPDLETWLSRFQLDVGKAPNGMKKNWKRLKDLKSYLDTPFGVSFDMIKATFSWMTREDFKEIATNLNKKKKVKVVLKLKNATYTNESTMGETTFITRSKEIDKHLSTLKGAHKKALTIKPLEIVFVRKDKSSATAKYKTFEDKIFIRPDRKAISGDKYASFIYIITHELGHRYESLVQMMQKLHSAYTTNYSKTDTMSGSEAFAEIFVISHFGKKMYPEYKKEIDLFYSEI